MYPLKFENLYHDKIWGGRDFNLFRDNLTDGDIGESWDVACHKNGTSVVANGELKGKSLDNLIEEMGEKLIGTSINKEWFPLLIKLINTNDSLSVQVHPDDEYGKRVEGEMGKTEVWYVMDAKKGANLIVGTKENTSKEQFKKAIEEGNLEKHMNKVYVNKGEVYFIKSGLIHSIGEGVTIAEIQQNSDTTYRVYDYNRGRELNIEKALDVVDLSLRCKRSTGLTIKEEGFVKTYFCLCKDFSLEKYDITNEVTEFSDNERFFVFTCVEGNGKIISENRAEKIKMGDSILIPAFLGKYVLRGNMSLLKSYVPDVNKVKKDILSIVEK